MPKVKVGEKAPDFSLPNQDGEVVSLSNTYKKNNVVLFFYPKDFSPGCTIQACHFRDNYEDFTDLGAVVIGVSGDSVESHKKSSLRSISCRSICLVTWEVRSERGMVPPRGSVYYQEGILSLSIWRVSFAISSQARRI